MAMFRRRRADEDFSDEVLAHIELETDRLVAEGLSAEDARAAAHRMFGNVALVKEQFFETNRWMWLEHALQDLRYAARGMRHNPAFLATSVTTLAVALGLVTVAFTLFNAYVLRPYAVRDPYSLYEIGWRTPARLGDTFRWREYEELRERRDIFTDVIAEGVRAVSSNGRTLAAALVSDNYFEALAPKIHAGRPLTADDGRAVEAVVLSHRTWKRLYDDDIDIVGRQIDLNGRTFLIVGVMGPDFVGLGESSYDLWLPFTTYAAVVRPALVGADQPKSVAVSARLKPGVSVDHARGAR
jgi:macrolide transport system ATP-binding/permease protein